MINPKKPTINTWLFLYRIFFGFLAAYFFVMGAFLMLFPELLLRNMGGASNQTLIGMLRGAGGATIPYALLYILIAIKPKERQWAGSIILFANALAIGVDLLSVVLSEYTPMQAMIDLPVEAISLLVIIVFHRKFANP
jgi:hypothetical protein